ncbi:MAG: DMT family transporter [Rhodospirillales bacterium]
MSGRTGYEARGIDRAYWLGCAVLVLCTLCWAGSSIVGRAAAGNVPPLTLSFWRWTGAAVILLPFALAPLRRDWRIVAAHWPMMALFALVGIVVFTVPYYIGLQFTTAINATLMNAAGPALVLLFSLALVGTRIGLGQLGGIALVAAGLAVIVSRGSFAALLGLQLNAGDGLVLVSHLAWSLYTVLLRWAPKGLDPMAFLLAIVGIGTAMLLPLYAWEAVTGGGFAPTAGNLGLIAYAAVFPSALAYVLWSRGVAAVGANTAGAIKGLNPLFGTAGAILLLGETPHLFHLAGFALILGGAYLVGAKRRQTAAA